MTVQKLEESGHEIKDPDELHDRMAELQSEMFRLEVQKRKLSNMQNLSNGITDSCNSSCKSNPVNNTGTGDVTIT